GSAAVAASPRRSSELACDDATAARAVVLYDDARTPLRDDHRGNRPDCAVIIAEGTRCDLSQWRARANGALVSPQGGLRISARGLDRKSTRLHSSHVKI